MEKKLAARWWSSILGYNTLEKDELLRRIVECPEGNFEFENKLREELSKKNSEIVLTTSNQPEGILKEIAIELSIPFKKFPKKVIMVIDDGFVTLEDDKFFNYLYISPEKLKSFLDDLKDQLKSLQEDMEKMKKIPNKVDNPVEKVIEEFKNSWSADKPLDEDVVNKISEHLKDYYSMYFSEHLGLLPKNETCYLEIIASESEGYIRTDSEIIPVYAEHMDSWCYNYTKNSLNFAEDKLDKLRRYADEKGVKVSS